MQIDYLLMTLVALTVFLGASQLAVLFLFTRMMRDLKGDHSKNEEFAGEAKVKSGEILQRATSDAAKIISDARSSGLKFVTDEKMSTKEFAEKFTQSMEMIEESFKNQIHESATKADKSFESLLSELQKTIDGHMKQNETVFAQKTDAMVDKTEKLMGAFTAELQGKVKGQVEAEIAAARKEISEYRTRRLAIIDERIIDIIEQVMEVVLAKKMSVADQSDLVYKSLDEAKKEHAFGK